MRSLIRCLMLAALSALAGCATVVAPPVGPAVPENTVADDAAAQAAWARVLQRFVDNQGRVDFAGLARDRTDLDRYVAWVARVTPDNRPQVFGNITAALAHHINAYNAVAMYAVLDSGLPETLAGWRKVRFFFLTRYQIAGQSLSLHAYENDVVRKLQDPRMHFALNCMSVGCPRLPREPFLADTLDAQLERETRAFFAETRNLRVDAASKTVYLSEILKFYPDDFLAFAPSLAAYANRYAPAPVPLDYTVRFTPYDWTVSHQPVKR